MKYVQIIAACDMTRAQTGAIEPAAETVYLALGSDPANLQVRELDLTGAWAKELREFLLPFLDVSHEPGELVTPVSDSGGTAGDTPLQAARKYNKAMTAWAQSHGYKVTIGIRGKNYFPRKTKKAYALHLSGQDGELTEANGLQPDYDPVTGNSV